MRIFSHTHYWYLSFGILLTLLSLLYGESALSTAVPNTQSRFDDYTFIMRSVALLLMLNWLFYSFSYKLLFSKILVRLHLVLTIILVTGILINLFWNTFMIPRRYYDYERVVEPRYFLILLLLLIQLIYVINLFAGILKRVNTEHD